MLLHGFLLVRSLFFTGSEAIAWLALTFPPAVRFQILTSLVDSGTIRTASSAYLMAFEQLLPRAAKAANVTIHNGGRFEDANRSSSRYKARAADEFAHAARRRGTTTAVLGKDGTIASEAVLAGSDGQIGADNTVTATLLGASAQMSTGLPFKHGNLVPLYAEASHSGYCFRIGGLCEIRAEQAKVTQVLDPFVTYFRTRFCDTTWSKCSGARVCSHCGSNNPSAGGSHSRLLMPTRLSGCCGIDS